MAEFSWDKFNERTYKEFRHRVRELNIEYKKGNTTYDYDGEYIGSIHVGEIGVDLKFAYSDKVLDELDSNWSQKTSTLCPIIDYDIYVANVDTGYGYSNLNGLPYDWAGGGSFKDIFNMELNSYQDFKTVFEEILIDAVKSIDAIYDGPDLVAASEKAFVDF